ncbi:MAG: hypothetical protein ABL888_22795 [Pirellulaceae bacterium]
MFLIRSREESQWRNNESFRNSFGALSVSFCIDDDKSSFDESFQIKKSVKVLDAFFSGCKPLKTPARWAEIRVTINKPKCLKVRLVEVGGKHALFSGYRGLFHHQDWPADCTAGVIVEIKNGKLEPGSEDECIVTFFFPNAIPMTEYIGKSFEIRDGGTVRATGTIDSIVENS